MHNFNFFTVALKNLKRKPFRTGVLVLAIALLVTLLIFATSFTISVSSSLKKSSDRLGADLLIVPVGARTFAEEFLLESKETSFYMDRSIIDRVRKIEGIEAITHQTYLSTIDGLCCDVTRAKIVAFNQDTDFIVKPWLQEDMQRRLKKGEALVGAVTSENLGIGLLDIDTSIYNNRFHIVSVLEDTGTGLDAAIFMTEAGLHEIIESGNSALKKEQISIIFAKVKPGYDPSHVGDLVEDDIVEVDVIARSDLGKKLLSILGDINKIFLITIVLSAILTILLVWAIFSAIANERAKEIGIMRSIGAKESHIVKLFLLEVLVLGLLGSLIGVVMGSYMSVVLADSFSLIKNISAGLSVAAQVLTGFAGMVAGSSICVAGAMMPINRIKKMEPLLAIKEE